MIVITAPTANIGRRVLDNVLAADPAGDQPVRVVVRDPDKLSAAVRDRVDVVQGSHGDPEVVARAFAGADSVFWLLPTSSTAASVDDAFVGFTRPAAAAMRSCGVRRVVDISALGRSTPLAADAGHVTGSLAMDDLIAGTGVALRALTMPSFMDNLLRQAAAIKATGVISDILPADHRAPTVAVRDIAAVASRLLLDPTWTGQSEVAVLGPEDLTNDERAAIVSDVLGTPVRYEQVPRAAYRSRLTGFGMSEAMAQGLLDMMVAKENGLDAGVARQPQHAIETPTTLRQWCEDTLKPAVRAA